MKMLGKVALISIVSTMALPAMACDMHGPNGMHWTPMSQWKSFSPKVSTIDPAFFNDEDPAFLGDTSGAFELAPPPPQRIRPSFSGAADRASRAAKTRLRMMGNQSDAQNDETADTEQDRVDTVSAQSDSETNTQPIR